MEGMEWQEGQWCNEDSDKAWVWRQQMWMWKQAWAWVWQVGPVEQKGQKEWHQWTQQSNCNGEQSQEGVGSMGSSDGSG